MKPYGINRSDNYKPAPGVILDRAEPIKHAPRMIDSSKRKAARQKARTAIQAEIFH